MDQKSAHLIGGRVASLAAAAFLIRDGQMDGNRITICEASNITGVCLDGIKGPVEGYLFRGERERRTTTRHVGSVPLDPSARCRRRLGIS